MEGSSGGPATSPRCMPFGTGRGPCSGAALAGLWSGLQSASPRLFAPPRSKEHTKSFDFVVIATGLFSIPNRPEWAQALVSATPPANGPWVVDVKNFTEAQLPLAKVSTSTD